MDKMTIREVADYFGTSKNTIKYRMTKLSPDMTTRDGNVIYILEAGIKELSKGFTPKEQPAQPVEQPRESDETTKELIKLLKEQLTFKDQEITRLTEMLRVEQMKSANLLRLEAETKPRGLLSFFKRKKVSGST